MKSVRKVYSLEHVLLRILLFDNNKKHSSHLKKLIIYIYIYIFVTLPTKVHIVKVMKSRMIVRAGP